MAGYSSKLPQLSGKTFITDAGLETTMVFLKAVELPHFAAIDMVRTPAGVEMLRSYYREYASLAAEAGAGLILESPTWRSSHDWAERLGCSIAEFAELNRRAIGLMGEIRAEFETAAAPIVISGCIGPRGDGYSPNEIMDAAGAADYHAWQAGIFAEAGADMVTAITMNYVGEAAGITLAAKSAGLPCAISFTVETDGNLPTGDGLGDAIEAVDTMTAGYPSYYMVNCAHTTHFGDVLEQGSEWSGRIGGVRANASTKSHAELDECTTLDEGDPDAFGREHAELAARFPSISVWGGCCGTDVRHIRAICEARGLI